MDSTFRRYKAHADIHGGFVGRGPRTTVGWSELAIFRNFGRNILGIFRVEASIILWRHEVLYRLSSDPEMLDLE